MKIIEQYNEYSAKIEAGAGYGDIIRVDRDSLIELLQRLPQGDLIISSAKHVEGPRGLLAKHVDDIGPYWYVLSPTVEVQA